MPGTAGFAVSPITSAQVSSNRVMPAWRNLFESIIRSSFFNRAGKVDIAERLQLNFFWHDLLNVCFYELLLSPAAICLPRIFASFRCGRDLRLCLDRIGCHPGARSWGRGIRVERSWRSSNRRTEDGPVETGDAAARAC